MKVFQINFYDMFSTGNIMLNIARVTRERGYEAYTSSKWLKTAIDRKRNDIYHYYIGSRLENTFHRYFSWITDLQDCASVFSTIRLIAKMERCNPDIVHLHDVVGWYLNIDILFKYLKRKNIPVVWTFHDCWAFTGRCIYFDSIGCKRWKYGCGNCPQIGYMPKSWWFDNSAWNYKRKQRLFTSIKKLTIVTPSDWLKTITSESFFSGCDIRVINNGIDLSVFYPRADGMYYSCIKKIEKKIILGVASTWSIRKGLDILIRLSKDLYPDYHVVIVGEDKNLGENITTIKRLTNPSQLAEIYSAADIFVNPTMEDNFPTVNIESLACGTPIVTYKTGGSPESVTSKTGLVVDKGDYDALKNAVVSICEKGKKHYVKECLLESQKYDMNARFDDYVNLYEEIFSQMHN